MVQNKEKKKKKEKQKSFPGVLQELLADQTFLLGSGLSAQVPGVPGPRNKKWAWEDRLSFRNNGGGIVPGCARSSQFAPVEPLAYTLAHALPVCATHPPKAHTHEPQRAHGARRAGESQEDSTLDARRLAESKCRFLAAVVRCQMPDGDGADRELRGREGSHHVRAGASKGRPGSVESGRTMSRRGVQDSCVHRSTHRSNVTTHNVCQLDEAIGTPRRNRRARSAGLARRSARRVVLEGSVPRWLVSTPTRSSVSGEKKKMKWGFFWRCSMYFCRPTSLPSIFDKS